MNKKYLSLGILCAVFCLSSAQNSISFHSGASYRFANRNYFGYQPNSGTHHDVPAPAFELTYSYHLKKLKWQHISIESGLQSFGIVGKKVLHEIDLGRGEPISRYFYSFSDRFFYVRLGFPKT
ncbi:MAG: hypothetical protein VXX63_02290 [Bacteroidota bacterium]|nr:hypothetical protein [Bacteroidota bacterium]